MEVLQAIGRFWFVFCSGTGILVVAMGIKDYLTHTQGAEDADPEEEIDDSERIRFSKDRKVL